jgi:hypothetical protein
MDQRSLHCKWCDKSGGCHTVKPRDDHEGMIACFHRWNRFRTKHPHPHITPEIAKIATHWGKFLEIHKMFSVFWTLQQKDYFLMRFLHSQIFYKIPTRVFYSESYIVSYKISKILFFWLKRISFARKLICKLLGESIGSDQKYYELFQQSYRNKSVDFYPQKMMLTTTRYLIANLAHLYELSTNYKN